MVRSLIFPLLVVSLILTVPVISVNLCVDEDCFQKCCPKGISLVKTSHLCQNVPGNFSNFPSFSAQTRIIRDDDGDEVDSNCSKDMYQSEFNHFDKCFSILPSGMMVRFNPISKKLSSSTDIYCIDDESLDDGSLVILLDVIK